MSYNSWEDIYREKETQDLYKIYKGHNYPTLDQRQLALKILREREFDFDNVDALVIEWKRARKKSKEEYEMNRPVLTFVNKNHGYIVSTIFGIAFLVFYIEYFSELDKKDIDFDAYVVTFGPLIIVIWGLLTQLLINKKKR
jgi:hypothetical protein